MIPLHCVVARIMNGLFASVLLGWVVCFNPFAVTAACHIAHPLLVFQIPLHRLADPTFKRFLRPPAQFPLNFCSVHGVTPVVPRTILDKCNKLAPRPSTVPCYLI